MIHQHRQTRPPRNRTRVEECMRKLGKATSRQVAELLDLNLTFVSDKLARMHWRGECKRVKVIEGFARCYVYRMKA